MAEPRCHECGYLLWDTDAACPRCIPTFYDGNTTQGQTLRTIVGWAIARLEADFVLTHKEQLRTAQKLRAALALVGEQADG